MNAPTGGSEKKAIPNDQDGNQPITTDAFSMPKSRKTTTLTPTETKVERDPQSGRILRIIRSDEGSEDATARKRKSNPLNDPLEDLSDEEMERLQKEYRSRADSLEDSLADKRKSKAKTKPQ